MSVSTSFRMLKSRNQALQAIEALESNPEEAKNVSQETKRSVKEQLIAVLPVQLIMFIVGTGTGWLPPALTYFRDSEEFHFSSSQISWIASLHYLGKIPGTYLAAFLMNRVGRRPVFWLVILISAAQWGLIYFVTKVEGIICARILYGVAAALHETVLPIYVTEHCSPKLRGIFCTTAVIFYSAGSTFSYILSTFVPYKFIAGVNVALIVLIGATLLLLKETPQFLLMTDQWDTARENFFLLQGSSGLNAEIRFREIADNCQAEVQKFKWRIFFTNPDNLQTLRIVVITTVLIVATGYTGVNNFIHQTLTDIMGANGAHKLTIVYGCIQVVSVCLSSFLLEKFNRRTYLLGATVLCFCSHLSCAILQFIHSNDQKETSLYPWFILACNSLYASLWLAVLMPLFSIIRGELFPLNAKGVGSGIVMTLNSATAFLVAKEFLVVSENLGSYVNYLIYAGACILLYVYAYFDLPETRGKSLPKIQRNIKQSILRRELNKK